MAYGVKYWFEFVDILNLAEWTVEIYENGFSGSDTAVIGNGEPVTITYPKQDIQSPIMGSECVVTLLAQTTGQYDEFLTAAPLKYYVMIYRGAQLWWQGVNTTDMVRRKDAYNAYEVQLRFNCGLGELQWFFYENSGALYTGYEQVVQIINNCFSFLPFTLPLREIIEIREDTMSDTDGLLEQLYLSDQALNRVANDGLLHGYNCNQLLNYICTSLNCRIYQCNGMWYIERITDRVNSSVTVFDYTLTATVPCPPLSHSATSTLNWINAINNASFPKILDTTDLGITQKHSALACTFSVTQFGSIELISNPYLDNEPEDLLNGNPGPLPARWDRSAAIIAESSPQLDMVRIVNPHASDAKDAYGYCFGSKVIQDNTTTLNSIAGFSPTEVSMTQSTYYIHAVQRAGDTTTYPQLLIDATNGQLQFKIDMYFKIEVQTSYSASYYTAAQGDATILMNDVMFFPAFQIYLVDSSGNKFYVNDIFAHIIPVSARCSSLLGNNSAVSLLWLIDHAQWITGNGNMQPGFMKPQNVIDGLRDSYTGGSNVMKLEFLYSLDLTLSDFSQFGLVSEEMGFDCKVMAPWFKATTSATMTAITPDFGVNNVDIQYIENAQTTNGYTAFYTAPDIEERWGELDITVVFGDDVTNSYPGAFRVASLAQTGTWHNLVGTKVTGQKLPALLFSNFLSIIDVYRRALTANMMGVIAFQDLIEDTDGRLYIQTGHQFNLKSVTFTIDMEEMAQLIGVINVNSYNGVKDISQPLISARQIAVAPVTNLVSTDKISASAKVIVGTSTAVNFPSQL